MKHDEQLINRVTDDIQKAKHKKPEFYSIERILALNCQYSLIIGERSNGKTYSALEHGLQNYILHGKQMAYIRRYKEDLRGKRGDSLFANLVSNNVVRQLTGGEFDSVKYSASRWYLAKYDAELDKLVAHEEPFCFGFSLTDTEHDKSAAYPSINYIVFDEFLTRQYYLPNEFVTFMNTLSTIIRHRNDARIVMLGNTVNKYCPYFQEMGLRNVPEMEQGKTDVYKYGESGLSVAVERCRKPEQGTKKSDVYFAFDNPQLQMITGGAWEMSIYPHLPYKYDKSDVIFMYFIQFNDSLLQCEIVLKDTACFTYIHRKTTDLQKPDEDIILTDNFDPRPNYFRGLHGLTGYLKTIAAHFNLDKVYYQDNEVGEIVRNFLRNTKRLIQM